MEITKTENKLIGHFDLESDSNNKSIVVKSSVDLIDTEFLDLQILSLDKNKLELILKGTNKTCQIIFESNDILDLMKWQIGQFEHQNNQRKHQEKLKSENIKTLINKPEFDGETINFEEYKVKIALLEEKFIPNHEGDTSIYCNGDDKECIIKNQKIVHALVTEFHSLKDCTIDHLQKRKAALNQIYLRATGNNIED